MDAAAVSSLTNLISGAVGSIILALLAFIIGRMIINKIVSVVSKLKALEKMDSTARTFILSFVRIGLLVLLVISVIGILGVPMASIVAVLASASVTVGLAMQGALSNLAGGIMLMFFRPFNVGDFVDAAGCQGVVDEITLFYTVIKTLDNKRITVPNGALMNANVTNYSAEEFRRVDLAFACAKSEAPARIQEIMVETMKKNPKVLDHPDVPFARISGGTNEAMEFTVRAWCKNADYWDVYFNLTQEITEALGAAGVKAPAVRVLSEK